MSIRTNAECVAFRDDGLIVLCSTLDGIPFLPGGGVDDGETIEEAGARETKEETGVVVGDVKPISRIPNVEPAIFTTAKRINEFTAIHRYWVFGTVTSVGEADPDDRVIWTWVKPDDAIRKLMEDSSIRSIPAANAIRAAMLLRVTKNRSHYDNHA